MTNQLSHHDIETVLRSWLEDDTNRVPVSPPFQRAMRRLEAWGLAERDKGGGWSRTELGSAFLAALTGDAK